MNTEAAPAVDQGPIGPSSASPGVKPVRKEQRHRQLKIVQYQPADGHADGCGGSPSSLGSGSGGSPSSHGSAGTSRLSTPTRGLLPGLFMEDTKDVLGLQRNQQLVAAVVAQMARNTVVDTPSRSVSSTAVLACVCCCDHCSKPSAWNCCSVCLHVCRVSQNALHHSAAGHHLLET
jgi:hypothetical protein